MFRLGLLLLLTGCGEAKAIDPEIAFRQCVLEQARESAGAPDYALAAKFVENCRDELKSLPADDQTTLTQTYTCAVSEFAPPCQPITD